jgi:hypothetical protein
MKRAAGWWLGGMLALGSCDKSGGDDPAQAYLSIGRNLQKGETKTAWGTLSAASRKTLEARSRQLFEVSDGGVKDDPQALVFSQMERLSPNTDAAVESRDGDRAVLTVTATGGKKGTVHMVREDGSWKLDLNL